MSHRKTDLAKPSRSPDDGARDDMHERVASHAAGGPEGVERRLEEIGQGAQSQAALAAEERRALEALGDHGGPHGLTTSQERADIHAFEDEGGRAAPEGEEDGSDRHDRAAVARALREAR
jgi:hypothetical protein